MRYQFLSTQLQAARAVYGNFQYFISVTHEICKCYTVATLTSVETVSRKQDLIKPQSGHKIVSQTIYLINKSTT